ncbi:GTP-binding protein [Candidatus Woesebacteria bacterium]|nr:GTP-binding protein [Candidatus Woesebacteria bacterium]HCX45084.1 GTP-binding protein [Patescibacteria group bacterium]
MIDIQKRIDDIQKEIRETPYHKGTEHHIGRLRARLAKLKDQVFEGGSSGGSGGGFAVKKHGDATIILVGFPSVGKSTLLNKLTNAKSPTAQYAFTTLTVIPGMMNYKGAAIQILDVPGIVKGASCGRGRGREVLSVARGADLLLIMAQAGKENDFSKIEDEIIANGVRVNRERPKVEIRKTIKGGVQITSTIKQDLEKQTIIDVAKEFRIANAEVLLKEKLTMDRLVDSFSSSIVYVPALYVVSKAYLQKKKPWVKSATYISVEENQGIEKLRDVIWKKLGLVRVYLKKSPKSTDYNDPLIMHGDSTLEDVLEKLGSDFAENKKSVKIWGPGSRFPGQKVSLSTKVQDEVEALFT